MTGQSSSFRRLCLPCGQLVSLRELGAIHNVRFTHPTGGIQARRGAWQVDFGSSRDATFLVSVSRVQYTGDLWNLEHFFLYTAHRLPTIPRIHLAPGCRHGDVEPKPRQPGRSSPVGQRSTLLPLYPGRRAR